jgi:DNA-binding transcriptional LysR family regulator
LQLKPNDDWDVPMDDLHNLDLNLFRVFDALMELRSVTRAAERMSLTQSAVSHALGRLRRSLDDPLFTRGPEGFKPTPRAEEIIPSIRAGLAILRDALSPSVFEPERSQRRFTIAASTYFCLLVLPQLVKTMRETAPGISLRILPASDRIGAWLDRGVIDLALGAATDVPARFMVEPLRTETMVWIAAAASTLDWNSLTVDDIQAQPRVMIAVDRPFEMPVTSANNSPQIPWLLTGPSERDIYSSSGEVITVYDSQTAAALVARTDLVALVPRRIAEREMVSAPIKIVDYNAAELNFRLSMFWHQNQNEDKGLTWLREKLRALA